MPIIPPVPSWDLYTANLIGLDFSRPYIELSIDSIPWNKGDGKISSAVVNMSTGHEAGTAQIVIKNVAYDAFKGIDSAFATIKVGSKVEIKMGYPLLINPKIKNTGTAFVGYISSYNVEINYENNQVILTIDAMDSKIWLMSSNKTEQKKMSKKGSDAVSQTLISYMHLIGPPIIRVSGEKSLESIYQMNESDYQFICRMADLVGAWFYVCPLGMRFVNPGGDSLALGFEIQNNGSGGIYRVSSSALVWGMPKKVTVVNADSKDLSKLITGSADKPSITIGSGKDISSLTRNVSDENEMVVFNSTVNSTEEAKSMAESIYTKRSLELSKVEIEVIGIPVVFLGGKVKLKGFDEPIDNEYLLSGIEHNCSVESSSYRTTLKLSSNIYSPQSAKPF